jgi:hypothetical protein
MSGNKLRATTLTAVLLGVTASTASAQAPSLRAPTQGSASVPHIDEDTVRAMFSGDAYDNEMGLTRTRVPT